jgi:hypothetical protein
METTDPIQKEFFLMKKIVLPFVSIALLATLISCATLLSESVYPVTITSDPSDAKITVTDSNKNIVFQGKTPAEVNLKAGNGFFKKASYTIRFEKKGYKDSVYTLTSTLDGWYFGNLLSGNIVIGMLIIDPITGAMWQLDPHVSMKLSK